MIILAALLAAAAPLSPAEIATAAPPSAWRAVAPENLMLVETPRGTMAIELAPDFAPTHIAAIRALVAAGRFDGGAITRVQDNYVVQWAARPGPDKTLTSGGAAAVAAGSTATPAACRYPTRTPASRSAPVPARRTRHPAGRI